MNAKKKAMLTEFCYRFISSNQKPNITQPALQQVVSGTTGKANSRNYSH